MTEAPATPRVWVSGVDDLSNRVIIELLESGFAVESPAHGSTPSPETDAIRWADVVVIPTAGDELDSSQSFVLGAAAGIGRPVLFVGPRVVRFPVFAASNFTLLEPFEREALAFQIESLARKRAAARERRLARASEPRREELAAPPLRPKKTAREELHFDSRLERDIYNTLLLDPGVTSLSKEETALVVSDPSRRVRVDFLMWVDGAAPFNPVPVEVSASALRGVHIERLFAVLEASNSFLGVLVVTGGDNSTQSEFLDANGRLVIVASAAAISRSPMSALIRKARNKLVHGTVSRGEL